MNPAAGLVTITLLTLALAGCIGDDAAAGPPDPAQGDPEPSPAANDTASVPWSVAGRTDTQLCPFVTCIQIDPGQNIEPEVPALENRTRVTATATWQAETPLTAELAFFLIMEGDDGQPSWDQDVPPARGTSPVSFDWDLTKYEGRTVWVRATSLNFGVGLGQDFQIEGTVLGPAA